MGKATFVKSIQEACSDAQRKTIVAGRNTVNKTAFIGRKNAMRTISERFTLRNDFVLKSLHVDQCPKSVSNLSDIKAMLGMSERAKFMALQETGGTKKSPTGRNLIIPNTNARQGNNANKVKSSYRYSNIRKNFKSRQNRSKIALAIAAKNAAMSRGFIRINDTIFQVQKFMPKKDNRMFISKPILNLKLRSVFIHQNQWMQPATDFALNLMQDIFNQEMEKL